MIDSLLLAATIVANAPGYYTSLANHIKRWLADEKVSASVVTPEKMPQALKGEKIVFLVGMDSPGAAQMKALRELRQGGGKIVVFHSSSRALADLMGVKCLGFKSATSPGQWSRMDFSSPRPAGFPLSIRQTSSVLSPVIPDPKRGGRVLAGWADRKGRATGDAAWVQTDAGWWMSHVLTADGDESLKAQLVAAMVGQRFGS